MYKQKEETGDVDEKAPKFIEFSDDPFKFPEYNEVKENLLSVWVIKYIIITIIIYNNKKKYLGAFITLYYEKW